jgi:hypothetical protein
MKERPPIDVDSPCSLLALFLEKGESVHCTVQSCAVRQKTSGMRSKWMYSLEPVLGIQIRMVLGLLDPDPDPLVRDADPDLTPNPFLF